MHLYQNRHNAVDVFVVGSGGVIGSAIQRQLSCAGYHSTAYFTVDWLQSPRCVSDEIFAFLKNSNAAELSPVVSPYQPSLIVIWAAGRAGFDSNIQEVKHELDIFKLVLQKLESGRLRTKSNSQIRFCLVSSIGGLFEGITNITPKTAVSPKRPYGQLKRDQEALLSEQGSFSCAIVRLPSVYSYTNLNKRTNLIQAMTHNALLRRITTIYGTPSTLRDYVWADDVGRTLVRLCEASTLSKMPYHLFSGKPISIVYIHSCLEQILRRSVHLCFKYHAHNALNICGKRASYDGMWQPTDLIENMRRVVRQALLR